MTWTLTKKKIIEIVQHKSCFLEHSQVGIDKELHPRVSKCLQVKNIYPARWQECVSSRNTFEHVSTHAPVTPLSVPYGSTRGREYPAEPLTVFPQTHSLMSKHNCLWIISILATLLLIVAVAATLLAVNEELFQMSSALLSSESRYGFEYSTTPSSLIAGTSVLAHALASPIFEDGCFPFTISNPDSFLAMKPGLMMVWEAV